MKNMLKKLLIGLAIAHTCANTTAHANIALLETSTFQMAGGAVILYLLGKTVVTGVLSTIQTHLGKRHHRSLSQQEQDLTTEIHKTELQIATLEGKNSIFIDNLKFFRTMYAKSTSSTQSSTIAPQFDEVAKLQQPETENNNSNDDFDLTLAGRAFSGALNFYAWFRQ